MAELLRDHPIVIAALVILLAALAALRLRRSGPSGSRRDPRMDGRARPPRYSHRAEAPPEDPVDQDAYERARRRARLQMIFALIAIVGFTLIALVNTFRGVSDLSP